MKSTGGSDTFPLPGYTTDPSAYHPHSLLSSTTTLLPARITRPPSSPSNPDLAPSSPYLPPSSQRPARAAQSPGQDWGAVGKQAGAVVNVIFSAAGVGGGVYWLGGHGHKWSQTKVRLLRSREKDLPTTFLTLCVTCSADARLPRSPPPHLHLSHVVGSPGALCLPRRCRCRGRPLRHPLFKARARSEA